MQAYQENISAKVSGVLAPIMGVQVTVTDISTGKPAALYIDNGVTPIAQPLVTDETGYFGFHAANGTYSLSFASQQIELDPREIKLYDPADDPPLTLAQAAAPSGSSKIGFQSNRSTLGTMSIENAINQSLNSPTFNLGPSGLPRWSAKLAAARAGAGIAKIACIGDSTTSGVGSNPSNAHADCRRRAYPARLAESLRALYNVKADQGSVWCDGFEGSNLPTFDPRITMATGWTVSTTFVAGGYALIDNTTTSPKLSFNPGFSTDTLDLYYVKFPGYADLIVSTGGSFNASTNTTGAAGVGKLTVTRSAQNAAWDIQKSASTPSVPLMICGVDAYLSTDHTVSVWNMGASGSKVYHWAWDNQGYSFRNAIQVFAPDLSIVNLTINDWSQGTDETTYKGYLQTIIDSCKVSGDVILAIGVPSNVGAASLEAQTAVTTWVYQLALLNGLPVLDLSYRWVSQSYHPELGRYYDGQHPSYVGYYDVGYFKAKIAGNP